MMAIKDWTMHQRVLDFLRLRKRAYQITFTNPSSSEVLKDLAKFCYANKTPKQTDIYHIGVATGRREVWLRIQDHLNLQPDELHNIYNKPSTIQPRGE